MNIEASELTSRFSIALHDLQEITFSQNGNSVAAELLQRINLACAERSICKHDELHHLIVSQNAFILTDILLQSIDHQNPENLQDWSVLFTNENILLPVLLHDVGYGLKGAKWNGNNADNHASYGAKFVQRLLPNLPPHFYGAIANNTDEMIERMNALSSIEDVQPEDFFPFVIQLADKFDYFRAQRVEDINSPNNYEENPYYYLASAAKGYNLDCEGNELRYVLDFEASDVIPDFESWYQQARVQFPTVWSLAEKYSRLLELEFIVCEKSSI